MLRRSWDIIRYALWPGKKKWCTVIEETGRGIVVTDALISDEEGYVDVLRVRRFLSFGAFKRPLMKRGRIVLSLSGRNATTIENSVSIPRENASEEISEEELEQLLFKGFWSFLNAHRAWTAKKMEASDTELVLANIEVADIAVGPHNVVNPVGLKGRSLRIRLRGTFVPRDLLPLIEALRGKTGELTVVESDAALSSFLPSEKGVALFCERDHVTVFSVAPEEQRYLRTLAWDMSGFFTGLGEDFGVDALTGERLFEWYTERGMSPRLAGMVERRLRNVFGDLFERLMRAERRKLARFSRAPFHVNCYFPMPKSDEWFTIRKTAKLNSLERRREELGIALTEPIPFSTALLFFYPISHPKREVLDQMLRRRAKWLIAYT